MASTAATGVIALTAARCQQMSTASREESCHVIPAKTLENEGAILLAAEDENCRIFGLGALKPIDQAHIEIKSMHTAQVSPCRGMAGKILRELIHTAQRGGYRRISLQTGSARIFSAARALYAKYGFEICGPFDGWVADPISVSMTHDPDPDLA